MWPDRRLQKLVAKLAARQKLVAILAAMMALPLRLARV
jgi:hypothetical protein